MTTTSTNILLPFPEKIELQVTTVFVRRVTVTVTFVRLNFAYL